MLKHVFTIIILSFFSANILSSELLNNIKEDIASPFTTEALTIAEVGGGLTVLTYFLKKGSLESDIASDQPLGKSAKIGYFLGQAAPNIAYALLMGGDYLLSQN